MHQHTNSFRRAPIVRYRFPTLARLLFLTKAAVRLLRVMSFTSRLLGPQYTPSRDHIEIDITYLCNLKCNNCNRSSAQAPEARHLELEQLSQFVADSLEQGRRWKRIRLLGGEPTLHPHFEEVLEILSRLYSNNADLVIEVVTNGHGEKVNRKLASLPPHIKVENSSKTGSTQPHFGPFNLAPQDAWWHRLVDYRNGCAISQQCGIGLTPTGYYPCAIAGGIDRVLDSGRGRTSLPLANDEMRDLMDRACRLCGRFRDGHFVPFNLRKPLLEQKTSASWKKIYADWHERQSNRPLHEQ